MLRKVQQKINYPIYREKVKRRSKSPPGSRRRGPHGKPPSEQGLIEMPSAAADKDRPSDAFGLTA